MKNWRLMIDNRIQHLEIFTLRLIYGITTKINNKKILPTIIYKFLIVTGRS